MSDSPGSDDTRDFVERRTRRAVGRRALRLIGEHVEATNAEIEADRRGRRLMLALAVVVVAAAALLVAVPGVSRWVSAMLG